MVEALYRAVQGERDTTALEWAGQMAVEGYEAEVRSDPPEALGPAARLRWKAGNLIAQAEVIELKIREAV